jgi:hypothetical protein
MSTSRFPATLQFAVFGLVGLGLALAPWLGAGPQPNPLPAEIRPGSPGHAVLMDAVRAVDAACRRGDVATFKSRVTAAREQAQSMALQKLGMKLDSEMLRAAIAGDGSGMAEELATLHCLGGLAAGDRACLLFVRDGRRGASPRPSTVKAVAFAWDGASFRLDAVRDELVRAGERRADVAETVAQELLR